ncbi:1-aminocyclopropane-1-carboxylate oxidase like 12 [Apostasia shenzhenica]|uniref:1-aminocyclopropane-1-carboxylate oxidase like 12 n=1 Tax=Apostasia shenzhenica TaxID=1088818 RepID=A0A2I0BF49_9ASPA|nr:1-aminocyclopropane-1-carboxylate oxidase like 12 [Apostasia shenzhenica]
MAAYDRESELKAFDDTKAGVKGLVDAGVSKIPRFFHHPPDPDSINPHLAVPQAIPVIDLRSAHGEAAEREAVVELVRRAAETFGFFQVVNHGVPQILLDELLEAVRRFNEEDDEVKRRYYTRDQRRKKVLFNTNFDLYNSPAANWRDTLFCVMAPEPAAQPDDLPAACRDAILEYTKRVQELGNVLLEILSEALGLRRQHLVEIGCGEGLCLAIHYYPPCPEPDLTLGTSKHTDPGFLTVLLRNDAGGQLQILFENQWLDVPPVAGSLLINIADLLQLISNDKFKSVEHRVRASRAGPRISVAGFFSTDFQPSAKIYGPIEELLASENALPKYRNVTVQEYSAHFSIKGLDGKSALDLFRL